MTLPDNLRQLLLEVLSTAHDDKQAEIEEYKRNYGNYIESGHWADSLDELNSELKAIEQCLEEL